MTIPRITVAMSVFDNARYLPLAIQSILDQTERDFEFLIVNDGSRDESGAVIDRFAAADARITAIHRPNHGLIDSLNLMIARARAPVLARMDGDDIALPERFARQLGYLEAHPDVGVLGTGCVVIDEAGNPSRHRFENVTSTEAILADLHNGPPLCHPSVMMRTSVVRAVDGYHRAYRHCEDYDLWLRLSERTAMANLPDVLLNYRHSTNQVSNRHAFAQKLGAAIAWEAHVERVAGRPDPTAALAELPALAALDLVFGRAGVTAAVRSKVALGMLYSFVALKGDGFELLLEHVRTGGDVAGLDRTVVRLFKFGAPIRAARLAAALLLR